MSTLGRNIIKARVDKGWNQRKLHEEAKISQRYLSLIEHDHVDPRFSIVQRIAKALGLSASELAKDIVYQAKKAEEHG